MVPFSASISFFRANRKFKISLYQTPILGYNTFACSVSLPHCRQLFTHRNLRLYRVAYENAYSEMSRFSISLLLITVIHVIFIEGLCILNMWSIVVPMKEWRVCINKYDGFWMSLASPCRRPRTYHHKLHYCDRQCSEMSQSFQHYVWRTKTLSQITCWAI